MATVAGNDRMSGSWSGVERRRAGDSTSPTSHTSHTSQMQVLGQAVMRYGLALVFLWIGALKFLEYEATNIEPFVSNSPIWASLLATMGLRGLASLIGVLEILVGLLIATRAFWPRASGIGSIGAIVTFLVTLSFMVTTPGVWEPGYGFGFPSAMPGQFLAKDLVLLGVSIWTAGEAFRAADARHGDPVRVT